MKRAFLLFLALAGSATAEIHPRTISPSGRYKLASDQVSQTTPNGESGVTLGSKIMLLDREDHVVSECFQTQEAYINVPGRDDWGTKAWWNEDESMVAVRTGGRTWSRVDFYSIAKGQIAALPHPDWPSSIFKGMAGYQGQTTRLYEGFDKWMKDGSCMLEVDGTAFLDASQADQYPQFSYLVTLQISVEGIRIIEIKKE